MFFSFFFSKMSGFKLENDEVTYALKTSKNEVELVAAAEARKWWPQKLINFMEDNLSWESSKPSVDFKISIPNAPAEIEVDESNMPQPISVICRIFDYLHHSTPFEKVPIYLYKFVCNPMQSLKI